MDSTNVIGKVLCAAINGLKEINLEEEINKNYSPFLIKSYSKQIQTLKDYVIETPSESELYKEEKGYTLLGIAYVLLDENKQKEIVKEIADNISGETRWLSETQDNITSKIDEPSLMTEVINATWFGNWPGYNYYENNISIYNKVDNVSDFKEVFSKSQNKYHSAYAMTRNTVTSNALSILKEECPNFYNRTLDSVSKINNHRIKLDSKPEELREILIERANEEIQSDIRKRMENFK